MRNIDAKGRLPNFKGAAIGNGVCHGCEYSSDAQKAAVFGGHAMIPLSPLPRRSRARRNSPRKSGATWSRKSATMVW